MGRQRSEPPGPSRYPEGDHVTGVAYFNIDQRRLAWDECMEVVTQIAEEFAAHGFIVRVGKRTDGTTYWLGLNADECADAFERDVDIRAFRIKRTRELPGGRGNHPSLNRVLSPDRYQQLAPEPEPEWHSALPATDTSPQYADHYTAEVFYRLVRAELEPEFALDAIRDVAGLMLHPVGRQPPFALRVGRIREDQYYWIAFNSEAAGILFERFLRGEGVEIFKQTERPPGFPDRPLRLVVALEGVPILPLMPRAPVEPPPRRPRLTAPETPADERSRARWARSVDLSGMAARLRRRRSQQQQEAPPDES